MHLYYDGDCDRDHDGDRDRDTATTIPRWRPLLVEAVKEQVARIHELKQKISELEQLVKR